MKVTVCFGSVRVVVPCGDGNGTVRDLMLRATTRYTKATGWPNDSWVTVHSLKTSDGGLLDPDDRLSDVADDREQIVAVFEERDGRAGQHGNGDGRSASSDGTRSPVQNGDHKLQPFSRVDIEVTGDQEHTCSLQVRRGSEPALNQLCPLPQFPAPATRGDASKRWSAAPIIDDEEQAAAAKRKAASCDLLTPSRDEPPGDDRDRLAVPGRLTRDMNRLSMQTFGNSDQMWRWADAADRVVAAREQRGWPPAGARTSPDVSVEEDERPESEAGETQLLIVLPEVRGPLGLDLVPESDRSPGGGMLVQRVEPDGAAGRDGRLRVGDRITQVNGHSLAGCNLHRAQELMTMAMSQGEVRLCVSRPGPASRAQPRPPAPVYPGSAAGSRAQTPVDGLSPEDKGSSRVATVTPTKKVPASLSSRTQNVIMSSNTRKLGRRLTVALSKGAAGLGFSVTTRDNPAGGHAPVYVKNILPKGAAIEDGRLRPGDRLLEIDGSEVTGLSQQQVVQVLRAVSPGQTVQLVLSRHEQREEGRTEEETPAIQRAVTEPPSPPELQIKRTKTPEQPPPSPPSVGPDKELLVFDIAVSDTERQGLGVSVKGRTTHSESGPVDVGIYIKNVQREGAASRDGRLQHNDQLIDVNNNSLLGLSNGEAMETLRRAMSEGSKPGILTLTVARRREPSPRDTGPDPASLRLTGTADHHQHQHQHQRSVDGVDGVSGWRTAVDISPAAQLPEVTITHRRAPPPPPPGAEPPPPAGRNPVVDRLTGRNNMAGDAAYGTSRPEPWSDHPAAPQQQRLPPTTAGGPALAPTVNMPSGDTVVIETDPPTASLVSLSSQLSDADTDAAYASQTSLEHAGVGFTRDQLGRQSISEKRHASKDAKSTDTYQRTKRAREEREAQRRRIEQELRSEEDAQRGRAPGDVGPSLGMKKSSSLESLQTMVHELALSEERDRPYPRPGNAKVVRGRGCNESFRAAVDRSYEAPLGDEAARVAMDTVDEETAAADAEDPLFIRDRTVRQSSLSTGAVDGKKGKRRSGGLLKGLGSMFRFGKHRKTADSSAPPAPRLTAEQLRQQQEELNRIAARYRPDGAAEASRHRQEGQRHGQEGQRHGPEQRHGLEQRHGQELRHGQEGQRHGQELRHGQEQRHGQTQPLQPQNHQQQHRQSPPSNSTGPPPPIRSASRSERVQELREQHQRRHRERQQHGGHRAETPDHGLAKEQRSEDPGGWQDPAPDPSRRPATRTGMAEPHRHAPYPGHDEAALYGGRRQHQVYHSQRSGRLGPDSRTTEWPAGGFFEYESVQAVMRLGGGGGGGVSEQYSNRSLPRHHERMRAGPYPAYPATGLKHVVSAGPSGPRRPPHPSLGIPAVPPGMLPQYGRPDTFRRGPPHRPPALSPPGSRV